MSNRGGVNSPTRVTVWSRAGGACERCLERPAEQLQHRVARGAGGSKHVPWMNKPSNLVALCGTNASGCHGLAESRDDQAEADGWWVRRGVAEQAGGPAHIPVVDVHGIAWLLFDDGSKQASLIRSDQPSLGLNREPSTREGDRDE